MVKTNPNFLDLYIQKIKKAKQTPPGEHAKWSGCGG